jgi:hypothetical protein
MRRRQGPETEGSNEEGGPWWRGGRGGRAMAGRWTADADVGPPSVAGRKRLGDPTRWHLLSPKRRRGHANARVHTGCVQGTPRFLSPAAGDRRPPPHPRSGRPAPGRRVRRLEMKAGARALSLAACFLGIGGEEGGAKRVGRVARRGRYSQGIRIAQGPTSSYSCQSQMLVWSVRATAEPEPEPEKSRAVYPFRAGATAGGASRLNTTDANLRRK